MSQSRGFVPKNSEIFNKSGHGASIYNGFGTTRTQQSPTLFVTNLPSGVSTEELTALFASDFGFQQLRTVRHMIFVDFYDVRSSTASMRLHQNHKFEAFNVEQGIMIDYDKDPRNKRNRAFTSQVERGSYTHGLDHEPSSGYSASGATIATYMLPASSAGGGSGGHYAPHKPRDATLDLINQMKQQHAQAQGVEVPLTSSEEHLMKGTNYRPQQRQYHRQSQYQAQQQSHTVNNSSASTTSSDDFILPPTKQPDSTGVASLLGGQNTQPKLKRKLLPKKKAAATNATAIASGATALDAVSADADGNVATVHTSNFGDENEDKKTLKRVKNESTDVSLPGAEGERDQPEKSDAGEGGLLGLDYGSDAD